MDDDAVFYHGISQRMRFQGFVQSFKGPTSFTTAECVAVMFAAQGLDGIIITVRNSLSTQCFDCRALSDFGAESETLFLGGSRVQSSDPMIPQSNPIQ